MTTQELNISQENIIAAKKQMIAKHQVKTPISAVVALAGMQKAPKPILNIVTNGRHVTLIGQITHTETYDPVATALHYARKGIDGISLFTDHKPYTRGMDDLLLVARGVKNSPVICQDYVFNEHHVGEVRASGASGVMIYASILERPELRRVVSLAQRWQMTTIVQVADEAHLNDVKKLSPHVVAVGEDHTFNRERDIPLIKSLKRQLPYNMKIMPLGCLKTLLDVNSVIDLGVDAIIVDEHLINEESSFQQLQLMLALHSEW